MLRGNETQELQFEITHLCNKMCPLCDHRIQHSGYTYLTMEQYRHIVSCVGRRDRIRSIMVVGGEPLCHPFFERLAWEMLGDFPQADIRVLTNGALLPEVSGRLFERLRFVVQAYPGFNDAVVERCRALRNVKVQEPLEFGDPYVDPQLDAEAAKSLRLGCNYQVRIVGTKLYACCLAEGIERYYGTEPVHVEFDENWIANWYALPTWKACQHCYVAGRRYESLGHRKSR